MDSIDKSLTICVVSIITMLICLIICGTITSIMREKYNQENSHTNTQKIENKDDLKIKMELK